MSGLQCIQCLSHVTIYKQAKQQMNTKLLRGMYMIRVFRFTCSEYNCFQSFWLIANLFCIYYLHESLQNL
jgi:hypothetical protein